jgi:hypothetical protein
MQYQEVEENLDEWVKFRNNLTHSTTPLGDVADFWGKVKQIQFNHKIDPHHPASWPTPWSIIADGQYDDLTTAIMIGYTIKLTDQYKDSKVEIRIQVDEDRTRLYNLVYVDDMYVLNYERFRVVKAQDIDDSFFIENLVELARPR